LSTFPGLLRHPAAFCVFFSENPRQVLNLETVRRAGVLYPGFLPLVSCDHVLFDCCAYVLIKNGIVAASGI